MPSTEDRARGALLGLAWGDAFGCPMEGWREGAIADFFGDCRTLLTEWPPRARGLPVERRKKLRPLGLHSDDTQQALALLAATHDGWHPPDWGGWLLAGMERRAWRGFGQNFVAAVHRLRKGTPPGRAGSATAGIGAAMRSGPLGARFAGDALVDAVFGSSLVTHGDIRAGAIAYAVAWSVRAFVDGSTAAEVRAGLADAVRDGEARWLGFDPDWTHDREPGHQVSDGLRRLLDGPIDPPATLRQRISAGAKPLLKAGFTRAHPNQGFALLGGAHGLIMALREHAEPGETLAEIVRQGFDTDTVAAIAGAVLGARFGVDWIPADRLVDATRLGAWADALAAGDPPPEDRDAFMKIEAEHTLAERVFQADFVAERRTRR